MTTIACDGKMMAADSRCCDGDTICDDGFSKLRRLDDGSVVGVAGSAFDTDSFAEWLNDGRKGEIVCWDKTEALVLHPDGRVECVNHKGQSISVPAKSAIGSGMGFALAAMDAGADAERAVKIAILRDVRSGGAVCWMTPRGD